MLLDERPPRRVKGYLVGTSTFGDAVSTYEVFAEESEDWVEIRVLHKVSTRLGRKMAVKDCEERSVLTLINFMKNGSATDEVELLLQNKRTDITFHKVQPSEVLHEGRALSGSSHERVHSGNDRSAPM
jgi:hypothetical protein